MKDVKKDLDELMAKKKELAKLEQKLSKKYKIYNIIQMEAELLCLWKFP